MTVPRFPKVKSPFDRKENDAGDYVVYDEPRFDWVFENEDVRAVEKLDGTNCAVCLDGETIKGFTRHGQQPMQEVEPFGSTAHHYITRALQNSLRRGYFDGLEDGVHYGEAVGPGLQANLHELDEQLFVPFRWLYDKCYYKSWGNHPTTFDAISDWFENELFSLFYSRMHGTDLDEASVSNGTFCEGVMFVHPDCIFTDEMQMEEEHTSSGYYRKVSPHLAKLRRDMFDWYEGKRH